MRADRLLSMLMLLHIHGRCTARQLASQLEVSERTIYRDVTALSTAGIPVYTEGGPGGGITLLEDYRTDLTGLRPEEAQALSLLSIPEPLARLGVGDALKTALLKLSAAVPAEARRQQERLRQRIHLDARGWFHQEEPTPCLECLQQAVWQDRPVRLVFRGEFETHIEQVVDPYGLVAKASRWYLVCASQGRLRALPAARILTAEMIAGCFERPADFDLQAFWGAWSAAYEQAGRAHFAVRVAAAPELARGLTHGQPLHLPLPAAPTPRANWQELTLFFDSFETARTQLLGCGGAVEVLAPLALRCSLADFARQSLAVYASNEG